MEPKKPTAQQLAAMALVAAETLHGHMPGTEREAKALSRAAGAHVPEEEVIFPDEPTRAPTAVTTGAMPYVGNSGFQFNALGEIVSPGVFTTRKP